MAKAYLKEGLLDKVCYQVYRTSNYSKFKSLLGNRETNKVKISNIAKNIEQYGWLSQPILVNEKFQIIDGQHRFEALKKLNLPIEYIVSEGLSLEECQALNKFQSNWSVKDYINSYAETGNQDYINFKTLTDTFPKIGLNSVMYAVTDTAQISKPIVFSGALECTTEQYRKAVEYLTFLNELIPYLGKVRGRIDYMSVAIIFILKHEPECNTKRLKKVIVDYHPNITPVGDVRSALLQFEKLYNYHCKSQFMNFANDYSQYVSRIGRGTKHNNTHK